ncbi:MAG: hypothetical protein AB2421_12995 [Thermotaleaceae bacterium]
MESDSKNEITKKKNLKEDKRLSNRKWVILITIWTFFLAIALSFLSETLLENAKLWIALIILVFIIFIGILFDLIGIAVASSREKPFHSMASNKIVGANYAVRLVRNAGQVSNFCNDVIGDICGIVSGSATAIIILQIRQVYELNIPSLSILLSGVVAALTVGGKAIGKEIALRQSIAIVSFVGRILDYLDKHMGLNVLSNKNKRKKHTKKGR